MTMLFNELTLADRLIFDAVRESLTPDLLTKDLQRLHQPTDLNVKGHCFVATHACFHLFAKDRGFEPNWIETDDGGTHWWLCNKAKSEVIDPTFEQVQQPFPYNEGKCCSVYVKRRRRTFIDKRSKILIQRVKSCLETSIADKASLITSAAARSAKQRIPSKQQTGTHALDKRKKFKRGKT